MVELKHPWSSQRTMKADWIHCETCGHCVDFQTPHDGMPENLTRTQHKIADQMAKWIKEGKTAREELGATEITYSDDYAKPYMFVQ